MAHAREWLTIRFRRSDAVDILRAVEKLKRVSRDSFEDNDSLGFYLSLRDRLADLSDTLDPLLRQLEKEIA